MAALIPAIHRKIRIPVEGDEEHEELVYSEARVTIYETFGDGLDSPGVLLSSCDEIEQAATSFVKEYLGISPHSGVAYTSGYRMGKMTYAYVHQTLINKDTGVTSPIPNAVANIAWKGDLVVAFGHSFVEVNINLVAPAIPTWNVDQIIPIAQQKLQGIYSGHPPKLHYLAIPNGGLALVHVVRIENDELGTSYDAYMDAHSGQLLSVTDFVCYASYTVLPIPGDAAPPNGFKSLTEPADKVASPSDPAWHCIDITTTTDTSGNNVYSFKKNSSTTVESSKTLNFNYSFNNSDDSKPEDNLNAARVNAFYIANTVHDFFYRYGFTEVAFNYQSYNFNRGGKEDDRVFMSVQFAGKKNNSSFAAHEDGHIGVCRLMIYNKTTPHRDSAFDNSIIVHELTHGLTNRMTGGGTAEGLQTVEARGMGEGWSDAMADWAYQTSAPIQDNAHAAYANGKPGGNRKYLYSTSKKTNPLTYADVKKQWVKGKDNEVHQIGQVWANILHNVHAALVEKHGFSTTAMRNPDGSEGNIVFLHLFIDALALQPCHPTFIFARDAWIQADANRYNGTNEEVLWKAFASRGLGFAAANYIDDDSLPSHYKPAIIYRWQTKLPPLARTDICPVSSGSIVSVSVNPKTVVTIFGIATATWKQNVKAELIDADQKSQATVFFNGVNKESLYLETDKTKKSITWGPFDKKMTVELTFYHKERDGGSWEISTIKGDKMKEYLDNDLKTAITLIPIDDGGHGTQDYQNTTLNVTRMTIF